MSLSTRDKRWRLRLCSDGAIGSGAQRRYRVELLGGPKMARLFCFFERGVEENNVAALYEFSIFACSGRPQINC